MDTPLCRRFILITPKVAYVPTYAFAPGTLAYTSVPSYAICATDATWSTG